MNGSIFMIWFLCMGFGYGMLRRKDLTETRREAAKPTAPRTTEPAIA
jgi:hypothetical protein